MKGYVVHLNSFVTKIKSVNFRLLKNSSRVEVRAGFIENIEKVVVKIVLEKVVDKVEKVSSNFVVVKSKIIRAKTINLKNIKVIRLAPNYIIVSKIRKVDRFMKI